MLLFRFTTLFLFFICFGSNLVWSIEFKYCQDIFLKGQKIADYIQIESSLPQNLQDTTYLNKLNQIQAQQDCMLLLNMALLKDNGLLQERSKLASDLLTTFNEFHYNWIMPKDLDQQVSCNEKYQWDIYDPKTPAYLFTRTFFQKNKKASQIVQAYGEPRIVRKGDDPLISPRTEINAETYKKELNLKRDITFIGQGELLGFLYEKPLDTSQIHLSNKKEWREKIPFQNEHNIYQHYGAGILGSPSFLFYHHNKHTYFEADGKRSLPRKLAHIIFQQLLCSTPEDAFDPKEFTDFSKDMNTQKTLWKHPITEEKSCQSCHYPLDQLAAGYRNLTFLPSHQKCDENQIQVLYPIFLKSDHSQEIWSKNQTNSGPTENLDFSTSYAVGHFNGKRYRTLRQLGALIAEDPRFYSCQVKRYYEWIYQKLPDQNWLNQTTKIYQEEQDGLALMNLILKHPPEETSSPSQNEEKK
jgi:hypothetical protein